MSIHIYEILVILLLIIECWLIYYFSKEHGQTLSILSHSVTEIKKKMK